MSTTQTLTEFAFYITPLADAASKDLVPCMAGKTWMLGTPGPGSGLSKGLMTYSKCDFAWREVRRVKVSVPPNAVLKNGAINVELTWIDEDKRYRSLTADQVWMAAVDGCNGFALLEPGGDLPEILPHPAATRSTGGSTGRTAGTQTAA